MNNYKGRKFFKHPRLHKLYLFELFDKPGSFNPTLHVKADVHFDLSEGVSQFDDGNLGTHMIQVLILSLGLFSGTQWSPPGTVLVNKPAPLTAIQLNRKPENITHIQLYTDARSPLLNTLSKDLIVNLLSKTPKLK